MLEAAGGRGLDLPVDVSMPEQLEAAAQTLRREWGGVDILFNNAGVVAAGLFERIPLETWEWILALNFKSVIYGCRAFIPLFKEQGRGHIVNTASSAGIASLPEMGCYNATKAAVISASETLRSELARWRIGVTVVCPTFFKTNLMDQFTSPDERQRKMADAFFAKAKATSEDVARHTLRSIERDRFYVITQADGRFAWWMKRLFAEQYLRTVALVHRKGWSDRYLGV